MPCAPGFCTCAEIIRDLIARHFEPLWARLTRLDSFTDTDALWMSHHVLPGYGALLWDSFKAAGWARRVPGSRHEYVLHRQGGSPAAPAGTTAIGRRRVPA